MDDRLLRLLELQHRVERDEALTRVHTLTTAEARVVGALTREREALARDAAERHTERALAHARSRGLPRLCAHERLHQALGAHLDARQQQIERLARQAEALATEVAQATEALGVACHRLEVIARRRAARRAARDLQRRGREQAALDEMSAPPLASRDPLRAHGAPRRGSAVS